MYHRNFDFVGRRKKFFTFSAILIVAILLATIVLGVQLDIAFRGGTMMDYTYEGDGDTLQMSEIQRVAQDILNEQVSVRGNFDRMNQKNGFQISLASKTGVSNDTMAALNERLKQDFSAYHIEEKAVRSVNPTMGIEFLKKCLVAIVVGSLLILLYIGIRFRKIGGLSAGVFAVVALLHDVTVVFAVFVLFQMPINDSFIAVVLTILGYSINSSIVVYDRIRENSLMHKGKPLDEIVNLSINQTLSRSINTTLTTLLAMVVILVVTYISGVTTIVSFLLPIVFGLISGFYSSTCLASELWVGWISRKKMAAQK